MFIYFTDIRDACAVQAKLHQVDKGWKTTFANPTRIVQSQGSHLDVGQVAGSLDSDIRAELDKLSGYAVGLSHTGQVQVFVVVSPGVVMDPTHVMRVAHRFLQSHGRLFALFRLSSFPNGSFRAVAEFCDTTTAFPVIQACSAGISIEVCQSLLLQLAFTLISMIIQGIQLYASAYNVDALSASGITDAMEELTVGKRTDDPGQQRLSPVTPNSNSHSSHVGQGDAHYNAPVAMYPLMFQAPFTPAVPYMLDSLLPPVQANSGNPLTPFTPQYPVFGTLYQTPPSPALTAQNSYSPSRNFSGADRADARRQNAMRVNRSTYHSTATHHNHVDITRIRDGIDVRTTVRLLAM